MTHQQRELLRFIERYHAEHDGVAPTFDEMRTALGLASKSGIHRMLVALEEQGRIRRTSHRQRTIEIIVGIDLSSASDAAIAAEYHRRFPGRLPIACASAVTGEACL